VDLLKELARATPPGGDMGNQHTGGKSAPVPDMPSPYRQALERTGVNQLYTDEGQAGFSGSRYCFPLICKPASELFRSVYELGKNRRFTGKLS
jgi:hypothetical protein